MSALGGFNIIGGDFNCALDPVLDRSTQTDATHVQTRKTLTNYMKDLRLIEIWRTQNPNEREYSSSYKTHSRINYFLISIELLSNVKKCWYNSIVISNHATVSMEIHLGRFEHCSRCGLNKHIMTKGKRQVNY